MECFGKVRVILSLCLIRHHAIDIYVGVEVFLKSPQYGGRYSLLV